MKESNSEVMCSVITTTYNHEKYIEECIESVLAQKTNFKVEHLIGEDDSKDNTRTICKTYADKYPDRIRLFLNDRKDVIYVNGRATGKGNFLNSLRNAKGKYVAILPGDDFWADPTKLQQQVDFLEANSDYVMSYHDCQEIDQFGNVTKLSRLKVKKSLSSKEIVNGSPQPTSTLVLRNNEMLQNLPAEFRKVFNGDSFFLAYLGQKGKSYYGENIKPSCYRQHSGGTFSSLKTKNKLKNLIQTLEQIKKVISDDFVGIIDKRILKVNLRVAAIEAAEFEFSDALKAIKKTYAEFGLVDTIRSFPFFISSSIKFFAERK